MLCHPFTSLLLLPSLLLLVLISGSVAQDYTDECPEENGFFADAVQCDRYYECKNGEVCTAKRKAKKTFIC